jgi:hypothetical protein
MKLKPHSPMTNHPNRSWRAQARQAAEAWLQTDTAKFLLEQRVITREGMPAVFREIYIAGFAAGREQNKPKPRNDA